MLPGRTVEFRVKFPGTPEMTKVVANVVLDKSPFETFAEIWVEEKLLRPEEEKTA